MSKNPDSFAGRLAVQQRVLPSYRAPFFSLLSQSCSRGLSLFCGLPRPDEAIQTADGLEHGQLVQGKNWHLGRGRAYICWQSGLLAWLKAWQPDALIVEANPRWLATWLAIGWMRQQGRPVLGWGLGAPRQNPLWRFFLQSFDALIAYSQKGAQDYIAAGVPRERVFVAPNAVLAAPRHGLPTRHLSPKRLKVLFTGRLQARKRVDLLIRACARLPESIQPDLWIIGDGPARADLEALSQNIYPRTRFFGALYGQDAYPIWVKADLFVLPGTGGLAMQEAMSYGLPVIAARGDGTQDDLITPQTGWRIPPDDLDALTAALREALVNPSRLHAKGLAAYQVILHTVNLENMVAAFIRALNRVDSGYHV